MFLNEINNLQNLIMFQALEHYRTLPQINTS